MSVLSKYSGEEGDGGQKGGERGEGDTTLTLHTFK